MMLRFLDFDEKLKIEKLGFAERLKKLVQTVGLSLLAMFVTFCAPQTADLAKLATPTTAITSSPPVTETIVPTGTPMETVPVLAYYYIWFDTDSWDRAKTDYPLLGRYSSDDANVMRQHVRWAEEAGINGFIVSWKSTEKLNRRLDQLVEIAEEENFKLAIIYESLDFGRNPLSVTQIDSDLDYFISRYSNDPVFELFEKPMVIWSGTWEFSPQEIASVVQDKRDQLLILASEKNVEGYQRLSGLVDGDAYYWSSVNPYTHQGYREKLIAMSEAIQEAGGLWVAPAAPGFDARLVGGSKAIDRRNGETLRKELNTALQSSPDIIGLISWNEFSENSHIEPSQEYGRQYLEVIDEILPIMP
jgi:Glycosyl hydrolase family 99